MLHYCVKTTSIDMLLFFVFNLIMKEHYINDNINTLLKDINNVIYNDDITISLSSSSPSSPSSPLSPSSSLIYSSNNNKVIYFNEDNDNDNDNGNAINDKDNDHESYLFNLHDIR